MAQTVTRFLNGATAPRIIGGTACVSAFGLIVWPDLYANPVYRVLFAFVTPRQAGFLWLAAALPAMVRATAWTIALLGTALLGWGLGFGAAALLPLGAYLPDHPPPAHPSGSPLGWVWFVGFGLVILRNLVHFGPRQIGS